MEGDEAPQTDMAFNPGLMQRARNTVSKATGSEWLMFFIVFLLHFVNVGIPWLFSGFGWFNGLNIAYMWKTPGMVGTLFYIQVISNTTFWVIIIFFFVFARGKSWEEFSSKLLMYIAFFIVAVFSGINNIAALGVGGKTVFGTAVEILLIIFIRNTILTKKYDTVQANYYTIVIIFLDFYFINIIQAAFPASIDIINRVIFPVLPLAVLVFMDDSIWRNIWLFFIIVGYLFLFMTTSSYANSQLSAGLTNIETEGGKEAVLTIKERAIAFWDNLWATYNESQRIISGDYYTGQVEENEYVPLGVFLEDIESSDSEFNEGEKIKVWATLKAYTLEKQKIDKITVTCSIKNGTTPVPGKISPKNGTFKNIESYDEEFITCTFDESISKKSGYYPITFNATFDFTTQAYLKTYYIEKERMRVLRSEGINILSEYGITDTNPVAKFTNGPIKIGMGTTTPPVGVPEEKEEFSSYLGVTIDNNWGGNVVNIAKVDVTLPSGLSFDKECDDFKHVNEGLYTVKNKTIEEDNKKEYKLPKSYKCSLALDKEINLLGKTPISIKYFKSDIRYTYKITEKTSVTVKKK